jgi:TPR repeat protein
MKGDRLYKRALNEARIKPKMLKIVYELLNKAHALGNPKATYALATWYLFGKYVKKDNKKAVELLQLATKGNLSEAYYDLAVCYEKGKGIKVNKKQAFLNYLSSALLGDKQSIYEIGRCYYYGIGVSKNREIANRWLNNAKYWDVK